MIENVGRKVFWIVVFLLAAISCLVVPEKPFRLGLDLQGGTRMVYRFDFEEAAAQGKISEFELGNKAQLLQDFCAIIRERVDPDGVKEPVIRPEGDERVVIEIPGTASMGQTKASATLGGGLPAAMRTMNLDEVTEKDLKIFPPTGGVVQISDELIRYESREGKELRTLTRGYQNTAPTDHLPGALIRLRSVDAIRRAIENPGELAFYIASNPSQLGVSTDLAIERAKVDAWILANPNRPLGEFNRLATTDGGPSETMRWFPRRLPGGARGPLSERGLVAVTPPTDKFRFTGEDLDSVGISQDQLGYPAVAFSMKTSRSAAFGEFTGAHINEQMAIVLNGEVVTDPVLRAPLFGDAIIEGGDGGFTTEEVSELVQVLRSGSLRIKPVLEHEERVGATLGEEFVKTGALSALVGLIAVLIFMMIYYRRLGVLAAISLICNLVLLMGAMAFLQATLTLPGVAGIILTVGMAVDANILIFERIREEVLRGRKAREAATNGFNRALITIVDANLTTLITAGILYKVGTGPVRGFATTLSVGILTSMFAALVLTRVLVHFQLERGLQSFSMMRLIHDTKIAFLSKSKAALTASAVLIIGGVLLFSSLPTNKKLSIDFLGGFTVTARTEAPQSTETIRGLIGGIAGVIGDSAEVKPILASGDSSTGFDKFRITFKGEGEKDANLGSGDAGEAQIKEALASVLLKAPVVATISEGAVAGTLRLEAGHSAADIEATLAEGSFSDLMVSAKEGSVGAYAFTATAGPSDSADSIVALIEGLFRDTADSVGEPMRLAIAIPEKSSVGAQVVGELRDKAIIAIIVSLFAIVLYIRARFAEYSYGFAAVAALVHDVLITLGVLAVCIKLDILGTEISLPMIAAFLTIIGYSLNDTIVLFDRIRENRPRLKGSLTEVLNISINQTLSRTVLTSATTLLTVTLLFVFNLGSGSVLESFAFALIIGVLVGTYSSIFVASPVFLFLEERAAARNAVAEVKA
ncbi:MAG: protein translocase subunit SecD [Planctomycetota bacterium]|nr:protein translocase subunit SecD [Planctomycetota bacterium]